MNKRISMCIGISMVFLLLSAGCGSIQEETPEVSNNVVSENVTVSESLAEEEIVSSEEPVTYPIITQYTYAEPSEGIFMFGDVVINISEDGPECVVYTVENADSLRISIRDRIGVLNHKSHLEYMEVGYWNHTEGVSTNEIVQRLGMDGNYQWSVYRNETAELLEYYRLDHEKISYFILPTEDAVYYVETDSLSATSYLGLWDYELVYKEREFVSFADGGIEISRRTETYLSEGYSIAKIGENIDGKSYEIIYNFQSDEQYIEVYNGEGEQIQNLEWDHSSRIELPIFIDYNFDGYLDMSVAIDRESRLGPARRIFLWDAEAEQYIPAECDVILTEFTIRDHQIWNWTPNGIGFWISVMEWNGNCLEVISEEYAEPDGENNIKR